MATGASIQAKIAKALGKLQGTSRDVKFRATQPSGGNALLGVGQSPSVQDTDVSPQPAVELLKPEEVAAAGSLLQLGDYRLTFDGSIPEATFKTHHILYGSDILRVVSYNPAVIFGTVVSWTVIARTIKAV